MAKLYDLVISTGTYEKGGETKKKYKNIGAMIEGDKGPYLLMDRTFNPAGVPGQEGRESVLISLFAPKDGQQPAPRQQRQAAQPMRTHAPDADPFDDSEIPF